MGGAGPPYQVSIVIFALELYCYAIAPMFSFFFISGPFHNLDTDSMPVWRGSVCFLTGCHR